MSHTLGPGGHTRAITSFGAQLRLPIGDYVQQTHTVVQRMDLATVARRETEMINARLRTQTALRSSPANQSSFELIPGDEVSVYLEDGYWDGPFLFLDKKGTRATVIDDNDKEREFRIIMLKPYHLSSALISMLPNSDDAVVNLIQHVHNPNDP